MDRFGGGGGLCDLVDLLLFGKYKDFCFHEVKSVWKLMRSQLFKNCKSMTITGKMILLDIILCCLLLFGSALF